jgi:hypothetical protein
MATFDIPTDIASHISTYNERVASLPLLAAINANSKK